MIVTCPECQSQYKLESSLLGVVGKMVRCVSCKRTWFQAPDPEFAAKAKVSSASAGPPSSEAAAPPPHLQPPAKSLAETLDSADDDFLNTLVSKVGKSGGGGMQGRYQPAPVVVYNPFGVNAVAFGVLSFLFCIFLTMGTLFVAKNPIIRHWPSMTLLYETIGFNLMAPGEGFKISSVTARQQIDKSSKTFVIEGKLTNMTQQDMTYPPLHVKLKNAKFAVIKEWDLKPGAEKIASGEVVPLIVQLDDAPDDGSSIEVRIKEE